MAEIKMKEVKIIGSLLPAHQYIMPILKDIREKYFLPEISPNDNGLIELLRTEL